MMEIGFWDYPAPQHGSLEQYTEEDWDALLDDMVEGGFNSLVLGIKWMTTGYRSNLPWLDQNPSCTAISSDNAVLHHALQGARRRGIRTRLLVVATQYPVRTFGLEPVLTPEWTTEVFGEPYGYYDLDHPGLEERILDLFREIVRLFGQQTDGMVIELEFCDREETHRVERYDLWAKENGRPDFATIRRVVLEPRSFPFRHWRDYTTQRRIDVLQRIEGLLREEGFKGDVSTIAEIESTHFAVIGNMNLDMVRNQLPDCGLVTYDGYYDRRINRAATMDFCMLQPKRLGAVVRFLSRGVMPWSDDPARLGSLEDQWRMTLEDATACRPDSLWFMGSDCRVEGMVCSVDRLPAFGFKDGREARRKLMAMARESGLAVPLTNP